VAVTQGLEFALLGPVRAWRDGTELALGSPQQRATLARISAQPSAFPLADVAEELFDTQQTLDVFAGSGSTVDIRAVLASS
jgi:hypothetical protein